MLDAMVLSWSNKVRQVRLSAIVAGLLLVPAGAGVSLAQNDPIVSPIPVSSALIDFDAVVALGIPTTVTVFKGYGAQSNIYILVPNALRIDRDANGRPNASLVHDSPNERLGLRGIGAGYLTIGVLPFISGEDVAVVMKRIRDENPNASFAFPAPASSEFSVAVPFAPQEVIQTGVAGNPLQTETSLEVKLNPLATKALLHPRSGSVSSIVVRHMYTLRGIQRDAASQIQIVERQFRNSDSLTGFCFKYPSQVINLASGKEGCVSPVVAGDQILVAQKLLKLLGYDVGHLDGVLGERTRSAIVAFQRDHQIGLDGVPSAELILALQEEHWRKPS
ncbi:peptidoglycan-binding domain-containing protein [Mesorhizobium sp. ES1-6]|uniref:peptidoglycan-binding domain-containing protein n=1 Tax=Mesorhizobium sp. ES1-6 TaxID=2876626 RepID=UPI001CCDC564|nr:peptidoglycan-binding domain-containing protein [Mesorhizobium sp. ES1-6]MBZ9801082.1 peptidoglycan-binding protein [Mesorhizobium sp. ES1-6]